MAAVLAIRQVEPLLPSSYCAPQCPSCKTEISSFDSNLSCVPNSSFLVNCGSCQQCIITYAIEEGATTTSNQLNAAMINIINLCQNTTVSTQVQALQSQASKLSIIGEYLASASSANAASRAMAITSVSAAIATGVASTSNNDGSGDALPTVTASATITTSQTQKNSTLNFLTPTATPVYNTFPTSSSSSSSTSTSVSSVWIAGPVAGSILGIFTVLIVIFFTRRKQRSHTNAEILQALEAKLAPSSLSSPTSQNFPRSGASSNRSSTNPTSLPELRISHPPGELETTEIHELPAVEPVGSELHTARIAALEGGEATEGLGEDWRPLPLSPLPLLFAMSEMRDERAGVIDSPKHETFYHP